MFVKRTPVLAVLVPPYRSKRGAGATRSLYPLIADRDSTSLLSLTEQSSPIWFRRLLAFEARQITKRFNLI